MTASVNFLTYSRKRIAEFRDKLTPVDFAIESIEIEGSIRSGLLGPDQLAARCNNSEVLEVDLLVRLVPNSDLTEELIAEIVKELKVDDIVFAEAEWLGEKEYVLNLKVVEQDTPFGSMEWDMHFVEGSHITCSPWWSKIFSAEEFKWQQQVRELGRVHLSSDDYGELKALQLFEAAWRICASCSLNQEIELPTYLQVVRCELPLTKSTFPDSIENAIRLWLSGENSCSGCYRPSSQLPPRFAKILELVDPNVANIPQPPVWTTLAERFQWEECASRKG